MRANGLGCASECDLNGVVVKEGFVEEHVPGLYGCAID